MKKVTYLDGLRGVAALVVVITHFFIAFYPQMFFEQEGLVMKGYQSVIATTPLNLFLSGNFSVCIFFVLSGYVLSYKFFRTKEIKYLQASAVKRYFRLSLPVFASLIITWLLLHLGLFFNTEVGDITKSTMWLSVYFDFEPNFFAMISQSFYGTFIKNESWYNPVLWTMYYEFMGSFLVFSVAALFGSARRRYLIYLVLILLFFKTYYLAFIIGLILSDLSQTDLFYKIKKTIPKYSVLLIVLTGLFLGTYTELGIQNGTIYTFMFFENNLNIPLSQTYHIIGAFLLLFGLLISEKLQALFTNKSMKFLGDISFSIYLLHLIFLFSFSCFIFKFFLNTLSYGQSFLATLGISLLILFLISHVFNKLVDSKSIRISHYIFTKIMRP